MQRAQCVCSYVSVRAARVGRVLSRQRATIAVGTQRGGADLREACAMGPGRTCAMRVTRVSHAFIRACAAYVRFACAGVRSCPWSMRCTKLSSMRVRGVSAASGLRVANLRKGCVLFFLASAL